MCEIKRKILFSGHSVGITNGKKALEWQHVEEAVNAAGSEINKNWSNIKVEAKRYTALNKL